MTGWRRSTFLAATTAKQCAAYGGRVGFQAVDHFAAHVIETKENLELAKAVLRARE